MSTVDTQLKPAPARHHDHAIAPAVVHKCLEPMLKYSVRTPGRSLCTGAPENVAFFMLQSS